MDIHALVAEFISQANLLSKSQKVVVGVSGGADSLCLLDCLYRLEYSLVLAHLDHQLRAESSEDAMYCQTLAERYGIPAVIETADVRGFADAGRSLEEAARILRYRFLSRAAKSNQTNVIATGHTSDDQVETILMHFLRGAGPEGLRGMLPLTSMDDWVDVPDGKGIQLVRPLLEIARSQTIAYCEANGLTPVQDPSNQDLKILRNRLRHELIPELETYNPGIRNALIRTGKVMESIADLQKEIVHIAWPIVASKAGESAIILKVGELLSKPIATQRAILRYAVTCLDPELGDTSFEQVVRWLSFIATCKVGGREAMIGDLELVHMGEDVLLWKPGTEVSFDRFPQFEGNEERTLKVPGAMDFAGGWTLVVDSGEIEENDQKQMMLKSSESRVFLDADKIEGSLLVRHWEPGDRIQILGMTGRSKVAELFVNERVPQLVRQQWPLVVDECKVIWIAGLRMAHTVRLTPSSKRYIELRLESPEGKS
jgi:tRNA(Ile)-lysidine synthase